MNCPKCKAKMVRVWSSIPNKDKDNEYEGEWHCFGCSKHFYMKLSDCKRCVEVPK